MVTWRLSTCLPNRQAIPLSFRIFRHTCYKLLFVFFWCWILSVGLTKRRAMRGVNGISHRIPTKEFTYFVWNCWLIAERVEASFCLDFFWKLFWVKPKKWKQMMIFFIIKSKITTYNRFCSNYFIKQLKYYSHKNSLK